MAAQESRPGGAPMPPSPDITRRKIGIYTLLAGYEGAHQVLDEARMILDPLLKLDPRLKDDAASKAIQETAATGMGALYDDPLKAAILDMKHPELGEGVTTIIALRAELQEEQRHESLKRLPTRLGRRPNPKPRHLRK